MSASRLRKLILISAAVLGALAFWLILITPGLKPMVISPYEPPTIQAEKRVVDAGQIPTDSKVKQDFFIYNLGGTHLRIRDVETTCGCTVASLSKKIIAPGDFAHLKVELDTSIKLGPVRKKITVYSNDPERPEYALFLSGAVIAAKQEAHGPMTLSPKDPLVLFKGDCATCHVMRGKGKAGKELFLADCAMCHGTQATGHGSAGPSLLDKDYTNEDVAAQVQEIIANGSPRTPQMPPFSKEKGGPLTEGQIDSLVTFLKFQQLQQKMGLLGKPDTSELEDEAAFQDALKNP